MEKKTTGIPITNDRTTENPCAIKVQTANKNAAEKAVKNETCLAENVFINTNIFSKTH